jgi:hypothetical protein
MAMHTGKDVGHVEKKTPGGIDQVFKLVLALKKLMGITKGNTLSENQPARKKRKTIQVGRVVSFPCMCCHICRVLARVSHQWDILTIPTTTLRESKKSHLEKGTPTHTHTHTHTHIHTHQPLKLPTTSYIYIHAPPLLVL